MSTDFAPYAYPVLRDETLRAAEERARVHGHAAGFAAGRREAAVLLERERAALGAEHEQLLADGQARIRSALAAVARAEEQLRTATAPVLADADASLLAAAVELAALVLGAQPSSASVERVRRVIESSADLGPVAVRVSPVDAAAIGDSPVPLLADPALGPGDALVSLPDGVLDARIDAALARARAALEEEQS